ncbi:MAG: FliH/SctL family protein [Clostridia bacterium]|nr:FliH/SctL family protein [Clostridia bacterium]
MKSLSRVIKSMELVVSSPRVIEPEIPEILPVIVQEDNPEEVEISEEEILELSETRQQAQVILQETEEMVKDLLAKAGEQAEAILSEAKARAQEELAQAEEQRQAIEEAAYREGFQKGYQEGHQQGSAEAHAEVEGLKLEARRLVEEAQVEKERIIQSSEKEILELALEVARKVIHDEVKATPEVIGRVVKEALGQAADREEITIKVNSDDLDYVLFIQDSLVAGLSGIKKLKVVADPHVTRGGCVIETVCGNVDARIERQLAEIEEALKAISL